MAATVHYLAVLKALYDYKADSEDEISVKEDQILFLIERTDDDWWRVKPRDADESVEGGLVPAAYVEQAPHKSVAKALYDYDASAPGEVTLKEDEVLLAFEAEEGWLLVQTEKDGGKAGFVPENYVELTDGEATGEAEQEEQEEGPAPVVAPAIIVPPSPPRPSVPYVDPAERVAASHAKTQSVDHIKTWSVSEVDKKGKKKKGTLGIGNGAIFFASEADKTPVQKWPTSDVESSYTEKTKHVHIEIGGPTPVHLHYNAGSRDYAEAIIEKLDQSKAAAKASSAEAADSPVEEQREDPAPTNGASPKPKKNGFNVHFAERPPSIISPREPEPDSEPEDSYITAREDRTKRDDGNEWCIVLYEFNADGDDELSVQEGDRLIVIERDGDEWWKVRDSMGHEGVVPASYVELETKAGSSAKITNGYTDEDAAAARAAALAEQEERERELERARKEEARQRAEAELRAKLAETAEAERKREERERERERERKMKEEEERQRREEEEDERKRATRQPARPTSASGGRSKSSEEYAPSPRDKSRPSDKARSHPNTERVRTWHDRTGQFKVEAEFLGLSNGKLRLHKTNGVVIEVPTEKMSQEDMRYIDRLQGGKERSREPSTSRALSPGSDDEPLAVRRRSLHPESRKPVPPKKGKNIDWFEFFLNAGCDIDDCTRYAAAFERDKIDEVILPDITHETMRSLGLREGDIIRVKKAIATRAQGTGGTTALEEQIKKDEELARRLQEEESRSTPGRQTTSPALFTSGPGGILKNNTRRGRPQPSKSLPPTSVDIQAITTASEQINRMDSPATARVSSPISAVIGPPRASSAAPVATGFDDDAWTNRPSSAQPLASTSTGNTRAPSAPPAQTQLAATQSPPATAPPPAPAQTTNSPTPANATSTGTSLARTTESDVFDQLARLSALRTQSTAAKSSPGPVSAPVSAVSPPIINPPFGFQSGMGMGSSPIPMGQIQPHITGFPQQQQQQQQQIGPRGPFAPVSANQGLLNPLIPTTTGFNSFVPTRPSSNPPTYNTASPQPPSFLNTQPTGLPNTTLAIQPTGFPGSTGGFQPTGFPGATTGVGIGALNVQPSAFGTGIQPQPTGLPNTGPLMTQTTSYPGALGSGPFAGGRSFGPLQPNYTGFNPGFGQASSPPPPVPPLPQSNTNGNSTAPANVFAQMKSGTFAQDTAPQPSNKYDALRPQPTGWGMQGTTTGYPNGLSGPFY